MLFYHFRVNHALDMLWMLPWQLGPITLSSSQELLKLAMPLVETRGSENEEESKQRC